MKRMHPPAAKAGSLVAALIAAVLMAISVSSAAAYDMSIRPAGSISLTSSSLTFSDAGNIIRVVCPMTLTGALFAGPITIARGNEFGGLSGGRIDPCTGGNAAAIFYSGLPWETKVDTVLGTLPSSATGLLFEISGATFSLIVRILGLTTTCQYAGSFVALTGWTGSNPYTTTGSITVSTSSLAIEPGRPNCPRAIRLNGTFSLSPIQTITIT